MYSLVYSEEAFKGLQKLQEEQQRRILSVLERCRIRPYAYVKKLVGCPYFRARAGDWRIIIDIQNEKLIILVLEIGHRKNIYRNF